MAFSGRGGAGRVRSNIDIAPLVGVVIVLLVIFLLAMPVLMHEIDVEVSGRYGDLGVISDGVPDQITVEITEGGGVLLNGAQIDRTDLAAKLRARLEHKRDRSVFVDFDVSTRYGDAVQVMDVCKRAGASTVALMPKDPPRDR